VLIRSAVASFQAKGDTRTPMIVSLVAIAANVTLKFVFQARMGAPGLALATACGAWFNLGLLLVIALRDGLMRLDRGLAMTALAVVCASVWLDVVIVAAAPYGAWLVPSPGAGQALAGVGLAAAAGGLVYGATLALCLRLFGVDLLGARSAGARDVVAPPFAGSEDSTLAA
jgi:putative peptidoglycan lipid II flippase